MRGMPERKIPHAGLVATLAVGLPVAVLVVWPQAFGAQRAPVISQLLAFRAPLALGVGTVAVLAAAAAAVGARLRRRWGIAAGMAIVLAVASLATGAVLLARGTDGSDAAVPGVPDGGLTVLAWNTQGGATPPADVARLVRATGADIVSLPEMDDDAAADVARLVAAGGRRMASDTTYGATGDSWIPTSVLIAEDLGGYRRDTSAGSTPGLPSGVWKPVDGTGPTIVAAHAAPPLFKFLDDWRAGLRWIARTCDAPGVIVAGDLNATVDHLSGLGADSGSLIGRCQDAALQAGAGSVGTWPADVPSWLAAPIDHVLVGSGWRARSLRVLDAPDGGTDHRPIVAVLDER